MQEFKQKALSKLEKIKIQFGISNKNDFRMIHRDKRDHDHHGGAVVRCKSSYTGLLSFFAVPLLMGDMMLDFMNMIDISVMVMTTPAEPLEPAEPAEPSGGNNNNGGEGGGESGVDGRGGTTT